MISKVAVSSWKRFASLPPPVQRPARKNYELWRKNPQQPSLRFKPFKLAQWSARVGDHHRAVGYFATRQTFVWTWIGTHEEHNRF